ncbi:5'-nucleotidase [Bowdeniella nasicola]|uniref:5'-nucleotidase n=1 Tax=Bowdeniella nasicola TaxID=208480 RepID=A0A1H4BLB4_9ACTO|nr:5'-nucleotidase C-terminal domain-containing protein [Bowdeniella nasicola]SEA48975.1 5'-nucleotidase [Bowdeniella nasicola]
MALVRGIQSVLVAVIAFVVALAALAVPAGAAPARSIDVLGFQDAHEFEPQTWKDGHEYGGIARLATVLAAARAEDPHAITAFGGDQVGGTLFGAVYRGEPFVKAFNELGVDVAGFGQHDFDFGLEHTRHLMGLAQFTWISSNLTVDSQPVSPDGRTAIIERGGVKVGFLSLSGDMDTTIVGDEVDQGDFVASARSAAEELQAGGTEVIIALTQIMNGEARDVLNAVPAIDAAMTEEASGSSPVRIEYASGERPVVSPAADYGTVVRFRASLDEAGAVSVVPTILPVSENVAAGPAWNEVQARYAAEMDTKLSEEVGAAAQDLSRPELGRIVAQAYREYAGTDFGWQNGGGIRVELPAGTLTKRSLLSVLPFGNGLIIITTTGAHMKDALEQAIESDPNGNRGFPRTAGLFYDVDLDKPAGERVSNLRDEAGRPLDPATSYTLALTQYVKRGGDGVVAFKDDPLIKDQATIDADAFADYITRHGTIDVLPETSGSEPTPTPTPSAEPTGEPTTPAPSASPTPAPSSAVPTPAPTSPGEGAPSGDPRPAPGLPVTGGQLLGLLGVAALLILGGAAAIILARRRSGSIGHDN